MARPPIILTLTAQHGQQLKAVAKASNPTLRSLLVTSSDDAGETPITVSTDGHHLVRNPITIEGSYRDFRIVAIGGTIRKGRTLRLEIPWDLVNEAAVTTGDQTLLAHDAVSLAPCTVTLSVDVDTYPDWRALTLPTRTATVALNPEILLAMAKGMVKIDTPIVLHLPLHEDGTVDPHAPIQASATDDRDPGTRAVIMPVRHTAHTL